MTDNTKQLAEDVSSYLSKRVDTRNPHEWKPLALGHLLIRQLLEVIADKDSFIEEITEANRKYPELNDTRLVSDAYRSLASTKHLIELVEGK